MRARVADLYPGYFALVMATGVVSLASDALGWSSVARSLLVVSLASYLALATLTLLRLLFHSGKMLADLGDHKRAPGFLTTVAGTCVLGVQLRVQVGWHDVAIALWSFGILLWVVILYAFLLTTITRANKPTLEEGINGAWLLATVSTQSVSVLGTQVSSHLGEHAEAALFFSLCLFLLGAMLYFSIITLIIYRFTFLEVRSQNLGPPYWINMGAVAITSLAGVGLLRVVPSWSLLQELRPFLAGLTILFWSTATWWIPLLVLLGIWKYGIQRFPLEYHPHYWGLVFPLGMYTLATHRLAEVFDLTPLRTLASFCLPVAVFAWSLVFLGMLRWMVLESRRDQDLQAPLPGGARSSSSA